MEKHGGPAHGMTLRDYFATQVLASMTAPITDNGRFIDPSVMERVAKIAYAVADAMLKEREKANG